MRIVHTGDWHTGRVWKNLSRLDEMERSLAHLADFLERERIDLLLVAGDIFDTLNPSAEAEHLVFDFFMRVGRKNVQSVVIAGNHDSGSRMDAWGLLTELVNVHTIGKPRHRARGGVKRIQTANGETAVVAGLPFAPGAAFVHRMELEHEGDRHIYTDCFASAARHLAQEFQPAFINIFMAHTHLHGAAFGDSERRIHLTDEWAAHPDSFPGNADYVALGHIHRPQAVNSDVRARFCGSPLQLDFGEAGQEKSFVFLEMTPGEPVREECIAWEGGKPLCQFRLTLDEVALRHDELKNAGWLRLDVPLDKPDPDLVRKIRKELPNALVIHPELPEANEIATTVRLAGRSPIDLYREFHQRRYGGPPEKAVEEAFLDLYQRNEDDALCGRSA